MSKKILILVLAVGIVMSVAIGGIAFADQATPVTLTVTLNNYYYPTQYPEFAKMTEKIVQQYEALHPNVHITLIPWIWSNQTDYETWLTAQYAAGKEPDIAWEQYYNRWIEPGWWVSLDKYLEEPDPYAAAGAGKEHWKDAIPEFVWNTTVAPDGKQYSLCLDWAETGLYYNEEIFNKLGISPNFTSWDQFMQDLKIIKEHGYIPLDFGMSSSQWSTYQWVDDIFTTAVFASEVPQMEMPKYNEQYNQYYKGEEWRDLTPEEIAKAIYDGLYSAYSPQFVEFLKLVKEFSQYWPNGFASLSYNDMLSLFASGKAAMMWYGNWSLPMVTQTVPFKFGVTYIPPFSTQQIPNLPKIFQDVNFRVGAPTGAAQLGITVGAEKRHVTSWAVDFLKYLSTPYFGTEISAAGMYIPLIKDTPVSSAVSAFIKIASYPTRAFMDPIGRFTPTISTEYDTIMANYLMGTIDMQTAQKQIQNVFNEYLKDMVSQYHYSWYK